MTPEDLIPEDLGRRYETSLDPEQRKARGAFYTPPDLAARLARATLLPGMRRVCDPAVGGGALLLAAARELGPRAELFGADVDADAVNITHAALALLPHSGPVALTVGDPLEADLWPAGSFDAVVANPPFLSQLQRRTARAREVAARMVERWGAAAAGYADTANLFFLLALRLVRPGGRVGIILPEPVLSAAGAAQARAEIGRQTRLEHLWRLDVGAFDAGVRVVVAVVTRHPGPDGPWARGEWARLAAASDVPDCDLACGGTIADLATVTADFRDQYYGLTAAVTEGRGGGGDVGLVTCGRIDPARVRGGARIGRRRFEHPAVSFADLSPAIARWADRRLLPKVMVATQTRIIEAVADPDGRWLPVVPVISALVRPERIWDLMAALHAPPLSAYAHRLNTGSAMSADAFKLRARDVAALPLPPPCPEWDRAADLVRSRGIDGVRAAAPLMCTAYGLAGDEVDEVTAWWLPRFERVASRPCSSD